MLPNILYRKKGKEKERKGKERRREGKQRQKKIW
jgi:hypothetical protein